MSADAEALVYWQLAQDAHDRLAALVGKAKLHRLYITEEDFTPHCGSCAGPGSFESESEDTAYLCCDKCGKWLDYTLTSYGEEMMYHALLEPDFALTQEDAIRIREQLDWHRGAWMFNPSRDGRVSTLRKAALHAVRNQLEKRGL